MVTAPGSGQPLGGRYLVGGFLGAGSTSQVYSAFDLRLERPVAIKFLQPGAAADPGQRRSFAVEARTAARLCHPNVVAVFDTSDPEPPALPYIVMEHLGGPTLRERLVGGTLSEAEVRGLGLEILSALDAAVAIGLVHCDIKPANIVAGESGWKLADFGAAWPRPGAEGADSGGPGPGAAPEVTGTPAYMAPELVLGRPATPASDVFSVGVVLYEALTGQRPYETFGAPPWTTAAAGRRRAIPVLTARPGTDAALAAVIDRAVHPDSDARFATPAAMMAALGPVDPPAAAPGRARAALRPVDDGGHDTVEVRLVAGRIAVPAGRKPVPARRALGGGMAAAATIVVGVLALSGQLSAARAGNQVAPSTRSASAPAAEGVRRSGPTTTVEPVMASTVAALDPQPVPAPAVDPAPAADPAPAVTGGRVAPKAAVAHRPHPRPHPRPGHGHGRGAPASGGPAHRGGDRPTPTPRTEGSQPATPSGGPAAVAAAAVPATAAPAP